MRAVKAKALRNALGFRTHDPREYDHDKPQYRVGNNPDGSPFRFVITGTIKSTGARRSYQAVKRNPVLAAAILGAQ